MTETVHVTILPYDDRIDLSRPHFVGLGRQGTSALAHLLIQGGAEVTGSGLGGRPPRPSERSEGVANLRKAG